MWIKLNNKNQRLFTIFHRNGSIWMQNSVKKKPFIWHRIRWALSFNFFSGVLSAQSLTISKITRRSTNGTGILRQVTVINKTFVHFNWNGHFCISSYQCCIDRAQIVQFPRHWYAYNMPKCCHQMNDPRCLCVCDFVYRSCDCSIECIPCLYYIIPLTFIVARFPNAD